jgi:NAD-dependent deacetylase
MNETMHTIQSAAARIHAIPRPRQICMLTGAGISAESGIPTFRGAGGLWKNFRAEDLATPQAFARDPRLVWEWYEWRKGIVREAQPNAAHVALAGLERTLPDDVGCVLITQNVDGLHLLAGSTAVIELHGNIFRARCAKEGSRRVQRDAFSEIPPKCECGALLRPDIVWFGESVDLLNPAAGAAAASDVLIVIGTSGVVYPAAGLVELVHGLTIEINPDETPISHQFDLSIRATATEGVPPIVQALLERAGRA